MSFRRLNLNRAELERRARARGRRARAGLPSPWDLDEDDPPKFGLYLRTGITGTSNDPVNAMTDDWTETAGSTPAVGPFLLGANAHVYRTALAARGHNVALDWVESTSATFPPLKEVLIKGPSVKTFIRFFDYTDIIHAGPARYWRRMLEIPADHETHIGFWFMSDRIQTGPLFSGWAEPHRLAALPFMMAGTPKDYPGSDPCDGDTTVDPEETDPWPSGTVRCPTNPSPRPGDVSGHSWLLDWQQTALADAFLNSFAAQHAAYWGRIEHPRGGPLLNHWCSDNWILPWGAFIAGLATNTPAVSSALQAAGKERFSAACRNTFRPLGYGRGGTPTFWANVGDPTTGLTYPELRGHFWEHSFTRAALADSIADVKAGIDALDQRPDQYVCMSYRTGLYPAVNDAMWQTPDHPYWTEIYQYALARGVVNRMSAGFFATGTDGVLFWQPCMRMPK